MLLGGRVDKAVQLYILKLHEQGSVVNSTIVQAAAQGLLLAMLCQSLLCNWHTSVLFSTGAF